MEFKEASMQTLSAGCLLEHGYYRIDKVLGQGGFGITYLATDLNLQRQVAIKEFFPKAFCDRDETTSHVTIGTSSNFEFVSRLKAKFLKEARNIAKMDHPNIIRIFAAFEENNTAYYVMEYIEGANLSEMVKKYGPISMKSALEYIKKIGSALEYIHEKKINHLDIKPANIMIRSNNTPVLIDFGLSKQYDSDGNQTSTMPPGFSHGYAPIEQYNDGGVRDFSPQTDIYSLAATLYYILSGIVPIQATRRSDEELTFPAQIPSRLVNVIAKAMSPGRRKRHASVAEFLSDLKRSNNSYDSHKTYKPDNSDDATELSMLHVKKKPLGSVDSDSGLFPHADNGIQVSKASPNSNNKKQNQISESKLYIICLVLITCVIIGLGYWMDHDSHKPVFGEFASSTDEMWWTSSRGMSTYTGAITEVWNDSLIDEIPNGEGVAKITEGNYAGDVYDGNFINGVMDGEATYTLSNGDVFKGTFENNMFSEGRYTKASGEFFEGTFRNDAPDVGIWYDESGNVIEELK